jgi:tetratricopeptide (TPR) repeat protein/TolB-like protein
VKRGIAVAALVVVAATAARAAQSGPVMVVPFELGRFDARVGWLSEAAAVGLTSALQATGTEVVDREARLAALDRLQLPATAGLTRATLIKVAELVGAGRVVLGSIAEREGEVTLAARVLDLEAGTLVDVAPASGPASRLHEVFDAVAARIAPRRAASTDARPVPPPMPAFELYVRALITTGADTQERLLTQALALAPTYLPARAALWEAQAARGAHDLALATAGGVSGTGASGTHTADWRVRAALSLVHARRHDEAFTLLTALNAASRAAIVPALLGVVQLRRAATPQTGRAAYYFNQAVERDPPSVDACFNLGYAYWLDRDFLAAAYWLREAVRRNPADGDAHFVLAAALSASGAGPEADRERELARRLSERWAAASVSDGVPRGLERVPDRGSDGSARLASAISAGAGRDQRELAAFHLAAAERAFAAGRDHEAIRELGKALYSSPYDGEALLLLGRSQTRAGLVQDAIRTLKIAVWSAESAAVQVALGEALLRARDVDGALKAAERALVLTPGHAEAADLAARARAARGAA